MRTTFLALLFAVSIGCSGADFDVAGADAGTSIDSSAPDAIDEGDSSGDDSTAMGDSGTLDSSVTDTGSLVDTGHSLDTGVIDTGKLDTGVLDTGTLDTGTLDAGTLDTGTLDTGVDMGPPSDSGATCPAPPTTASYDASGLKCGDIPAKYSTFLADAKVCTCDADCKTSIGRDFCGCNTFVNQGTDAYAALVSIRAHYSMLGCVTACPLGLCMIAEGAHCVAGSAGVKTCRDDGP